jgi:hypothetical protein
MPTVFNDIYLTSIVPVAERTRRVRGPFYRLYLRLSEKAPGEWAEAFSLIWSQRVFYHLKRRTGVEDEFLWIECEPVELEEYHLDNLKSTVAWTNQLYRKGLQAQSQSGKPKDEWYWLDHVSMDDLAGGLNRPT